MITYAELYGNIKKRPLKCSLDNILIDGINNQIGGKLIDRLGGEKFAEIGDAMSLINENLSPLKHLSGNITSKMNDSLSPLKGISFGMKMPSL